MESIKIGILGTADIAFRRFLPALEKCDGITYGGVASRTVEKTTPFVEKFGGKAYPSYESLLEDQSIQAVYLPLPPSLHYEWGKKVLESGKHLLMEKPFTTSLEHTQELLQLAKEKNLTVHENYMFLYHPQLAWIKKELDQGAIGEFRLLRSSFTFPKRDSSDFRYNKELGGGALLDCGGYPICLSSYFLGDTTKLVTSQLHFSTEFDVDIYGSATLANDVGQVAQISFGMDNCYQCSVEILGSTGRIFTDRIFSAPSDFAPKVDLMIGNTLEKNELECADSFRLSVEEFALSIKDQSKKEGIAMRILEQGTLVDGIRKEYIL